MKKFHRSQAKKVWVFVLATAILLLSGSAFLMAKNRQGSSLRKGKTSKENKVIGEESVPLGSNSEAGNYQAGAYTDTSSVTDGFRGLFPSISADQQRMRYIGYHNTVAKQWLFNEKKEQILGQVPSSAGDFDKWRWSPSANLALAHYKSDPDNPKCQDCWSVMDYTRGDLVQKRLRGGVRDIVWSPDGKKILATVMSVDDFPNSKIVLAQADLSNQQTVARIEGGGWELDWNHPNKALVWRIQDSAEGPPGFPIYLLDMTTKKPVLRVLVKGNNAMASLSPSGHWLAFEKVINEKRSSFLMNTFSRKTARLPKGTRIDSIYWSGDGNWLVFDQFNPEAEDNSMAHSLIIINLAKGKIVSRFKPDTPVYFTLSPIGIIGDSLFYEHEDFIFGTKVPK